MKKTLVTLLFLCSSAFAATFNAYTADLPPFTMSMEEKGISHELVEELAKRTGHTINIKYLPWKRSQVEVKNDPQGLIFSISRSKGRESQFIWLTQLLEAGHNFITIDKAIDSFAEAKNVKKITVLGGTPREKQLIKENFSNYEVAVDTTTAAKLLNSKRVDAWFTYDVRAKYVYKTLGLDPSKLVIGKATEISKLWLAGNNAIDKSVVPSFEKAMKEMKADGTYDAILKKYLGN